jgi:hypothetical protein
VKGQKTKTDFIDTNSRPVSLRIQHDVLVLVVGKARQRCRCGELETSPRSLQR